MPLRDLLLFGVFGALVPPMLVHPYIGALAWVVFGLLNPQLLAFGPAASFPFSMVIAVCTMVGMVITRDPRQLKGGLAAAVLAILLCWMTLTTFFALNADAAWPMWSRVMKIFVMTFVLMFVLNTKRHVELLLAGILLSIAFYAIKGGLFTILTGGKALVLGPGESVIGGNNALAVAIIMVIPLFAHFYQQTNRKWVRIAIVGSILLCIAAVLGSYSRGALLALFAMGVLLWFRSSYKAVLLMLAVLTVSVLIPFMPDHWDSRMRTIETYEQDGSAMGRIYAWQTAFNISTDRVLGGGYEYPLNREVIATYSPSGQMLVAHSIYFQVLGEHGFIGLGLYLLFWALVWHQCTLLRRSTRGSTELRWAYSLASMIQVSLVGYAVGGAFLNLAYWDMPYYLYGAIIVTRHVVKRAEEVAAAETRDVAARARPALVVPALARHQEST
jgi:probable O-glycosylation ligase (exosortase A-associated)